MRIEELILEGFKSYPVRTTISGEFTPTAACPALHTGLRTAQVDQSARAGDNRV
jgi:hypothetical protein